MKGNGPEAYVPRYNWRMSPGVPQEMRELETQLAEQLDHIQASADRFDSGVQSEAKRLALPSASSSMIAGSRAHYSGN